MLDFNCASISIRYRHPDNSIMDMYFFDKESNYKTCCSSLLGGATFINIKSGEVLTTYNPFLDNPLRDCRFYENEEMLFNSIKYEV